MCINHFPNWKNTFVSFRVPKTRVGASFSSWISFESDTGDDGGGGEDAGVDGVGGGGGGDGGCGDSSVGFSA